MDASAVDQKRLDVAEPPKHSSASAGLSGRLHYYAVELQLLTPAFLIAFACATLAFIAVAGVEESRSRHTESMVEGVIRISQATLSVSTAHAVAPTSYATTSRNRILELKNIPGLKRYRAALDAALGYALAYDVTSTVRTLADVQLGVLSELTLREDPLRASSTLLYTFLRNLQLTRNVAADLMQMNEGTLSSERALRAVGMNAACSTQMEDFVATYFPSMTDVLTCDASAQSAVYGNANVDLALDPKWYSEVLQELAGVAASHQHFLDGMYESFVAQYRSERAFAPRITVLSIAMVVSVVGSVLSVILCLGQYRSLHEQSVVESDFHCNAHRVKIQADTLRVVDEIAARVGVMSPLPQYLAQSAATHQIELHLRRAVEPLTMLRPFVPNYMYARHMRNMSVTCTTTSALLRNGEMLNLTLGLKKKNASVLFVGLRDYNKLGANLDSLNELLSAVQLACSHFQGTVMQLCSEGVVALFARATINEDENDERVEDGEVLAVHAAMAIHEICSSALDQGNGARREPFRVSMSVVQAVSYQGILSFHVSKRFGLLSAAMSHALAIEPLNDVHSTSILVSSALNELVSDMFITKPVHYVPNVGSVYNIVAAVPHDDDAGSQQSGQAARSGALEKLREKTNNWKKVWEKYEALMATDKPSYEMLEEAHKDLEGYKVFQMQQNEEDVAYNIALQAVKRLAQHLGVNLGATVEEE